MFFPGHLFFRLINMKKLYVILVCLTFLFSSVYSGGFSSLKLGTDARSGGMGMAFTALSNTGSGGFWNPAGLATMQKHHIQLSVHKWIQGVRNEFVGYGSGNGRSGFGIFFLHTQISDLEYRIAAPTPEPIGTFSNHEIILGISYAKKVKRRVSCGITIKGLYEKIFTDEATGIAVDLGVLWELKKNGFRIGGGIQNIGETGKLQEETIELPVTWKFGFAFPLDRLGGKWIFVLDAIQELHLPFHVHSGMEFTWRDILMARAGYQTGYETRNVTAGLGFKWTVYQLDYSFMPLQTGLGDAHRLSLGIYW